MSRKTLTFKILEILRDNPGLSLKELSSLLDVNVAKIREIVYRLKSSGYLEKTGKGYILTNRGVKLLEYISREKTEVPETSEKVGESKTDQVEPLPVHEPGKAGPPRVTETSIEQRDTCIDVKEFNELAERVRSLEDKVSRLERSLEDVIRALEIISKNKKKDQRQVFMELPVMSYNEALSKLGNVLDKLIMDGKIIRIGSLVVDAEFYREFKSKFPIKTMELDKLSHFERILLEELRKEAMVVLHAGREYRLIESS